MASPAEQNNESVDKIHISSEPSKRSLFSDFDVKMVNKAEEQTQAQLDLPTAQDEPTDLSKKQEQEPVKPKIDMITESDTDNQGRQVPQLQQTELDQGATLPSETKETDLVRETTPISSVESGSSDQQSEVVVSQKTPSNPPPVQTKDPGNEMADLEDDIPIVPAQGYGAPQAKKPDTSPNFIDSFAKWLANCDGGSSKPAKVDRRQQRHTATVTGYVPRELADETKRNLVSEITKSFKENDLHGEKTSAPKVGKMQSITGTVEVSKSSAQGGDESDEDMSCEDEGPSEMDIASKPDDPVEPMDDIPCVVSSHPLPLQEDSLQSAAKDSESCMDGSSMASESVSETSESLSSVNKPVRHEDGETRDSEMMEKKDETKGNESEAGDEECPEGEKQLSGDADEEEEEDKENLEEEAKDSLGKLEDSSPTCKKKKTRRGSIGFGVIPSGQDAIIMGQPGGKFPPEKLFEYQWPQDKGDFFMLQEQISEYLGVKSFKRKYPDLPRKLVDITERNFLKDKGIVTEMQCDLGLTAVRSEDVLDLMQRDYEEKYKEYTAVLQEREKQKMKEKTKGYEQPNVEKSKMAAFIKKAVKSAADFNSQFMKELRDERKAYYDLQTQDVQFPLGRCKRLPKEATKVGAYPVAVIPGQYQDYYKKYSSNELKYFPLNSAIYGPPKKLKTIFADPNEPTDSESEGSVGSHDSSGSGSGSDTGSSSPSTKEEAAVDTTNAPAENGSPIKEEEKVPEEEAPKCKLCSEVLADGEEEELVNCSECKGGSHPSCLELTPAMVEIIKTYPWQCMECKTCVECMDPGDEDKMMFCDQCDRGYHTFCVGLQRIPTGKWECHSCRNVDPATPIRKKRKYERKQKPDKDGEESPQKKVKKEKKEKKETPVKVKKEKKEKEKKTEQPEKEKKERKKRVKKEKSEDE